MTSTFTAQEIADFKESFDAFDRNKDGSINYTELRSMLRMVGQRLNAAGLAALLDEHDVNNDQHIDFNEFLQLASKLTKNKASSIGAAPPVAPASPAQKI